MNNNIETPDVSQSNPDLIAENASEQANWEGIDKTLPLEAVNLDAAQYVRDHPVIVTGAFKSPEGWKTPEYTNRKLEELEAARNVSTQRPIGSSSSIELVAGRILVPKLRR